MVCPSGAVHLVFAHPQCAFQPQIFGVEECAISQFTWAQGLGGGFDAPHAAYVSTSAEGSGVGKPSEPPVAGTRSKPVSGTEVVSAAQNGCVRLSFKFQLAEQTTVLWETVVVGRRLYLSIVHLPEGSKEAFVSLLEYAEEVLGCSHVLICFKKDRSDRAMLIRNFMFLGFVAIPPGHPMAPANNDHFYMLYEIE
ncbi:ornithine decarboxylase antizyme 1-like [Homarus americanus]|uniref:ornithine decarboxylase antizyme 1-like n=1 Tax=Homarus americanus TaxID=6706 RepID=UPI001C474C93|nr:ornithine decarboxylase antizyme 1-like [Homarus americanus]